MHARAPVTALFLFLPGLVAAEEAPRTIHTSGEALVRIAPDEVVLHVGVETFAAQLKDAKAMNDDASRHMLKAVRDLGGIEEKHVQTAHMEIGIRYRPPHGPASGIEGYLASRTYAITLREPKRFEELLDAALSNGANRLLGFEFRTTELRKHRDEARKLAIRAAREKAVALAGELSCRVGAPRSIGEGHVGYVGWSGSLWQRNGPMSQNAVSGGQGGDGGDTLPLGQIGVRAQISVVFDLVPE